MTTTLTRAAELPPLDRDAGYRIARAELDASIAFYAALGAQEWDAPTACAPWRVREMVAHMVGAMDESIRFRVLLRHVRQGRRRYPDKSDLDALNEAQVDERRDWPPEALLRAFRDLGPRAVEARRKLPAPLRAVRIPKPDGGRMSLAYLNDVIYPRDLWMHRLDAARATGRDFTLGEHDRALVAGVVRDLALGWTGPDVTLTLTGPAGGSWALGQRPGPELRMDAVACCLLLSGREPGASPQAAPGAEAAVPVLRAARVLF
ncbi:MAG TPA: maleylpyruvate isomerase family mycothiol-dependent enzyme [Egibacteraceae bacterium]|nr:maleylpyruvate isomerase family mycothiol-dependent enzyme [Egibacteraceae bacterium]